MLKAGNVIKQTPLKVIKVSERNVFYVNHYERISKVPLMVLLYRKHLHLSATFCEKLNFYAVIGIILVNKILISVDFIPVMWYNIIKSGVIV